MADNFRQPQNRTANQRAGRNLAGAPNAGFNRAGGTLGAGGLAGDQAGYEFGTELAGTTPAAGANQRAGQTGTAKVPGARQFRGDKA